MHQSDQLFKASVAGDGVCVLFSAGRDFLHYFHITLPFDQGIELRIPNEYFAVIWPACSDVRLLLHRYRCLDSRLTGSGYAQCVYSEMITLIPDSKYKLYIYHNLRSFNENHKKYPLNQAPASCRLIYIRKDFLKNQQKKIFAAEFAIPEHVTVFEPAINTDLGVIEEEERHQRPGCFEVSSSMFETLTVKLLRVYSSNFLNYHTQIVQPSRQTLAGNLPELRKYIRDHCHDNLSVAQLAKQLGVHRCTLSRCFAKTYNMTLLDYIHDVRLEKIRQMLNDEELPISRISSLFGYKTISSFSNFFRLKTGITPTRYRRISLTGQSCDESLDNSSV